MTTIAIIGGGISGLFAALRLASGGKDIQVIVLERSPSLGGLLHGYRYETELGALNYDCGTHIFQETGSAAIDRTIQTCLPEGAWRWLEGADKDLAGAYFNGRFQTNSSAPDLRLLPRADFERYLGGLVRAACTDDRSGVASPLAPADKAIKAKYGEPAAAEIVGPIIERIFKRPLPELTDLALQLSGISRLLFFDEPIANELMRIDRLRAVIGYPEQRKLPERWQHARRGFYPRTGGTRSLIEAMRARLKEMGVPCVTDAEITSLQTLPRGAALTYRAGIDQPRHVEADHVFWTAGLLSYCRLKGITIPNVQSGPPLSHAIVNLAFPRPFDLGDVHYLYGYDPAVNFFRITNYGAFDGGGDHADCVRITAEILFNKAQDREQLVAMTLKDLSRLTGDNVEDQLIFSRAEIAPTGFPTPTISFMHAIADMRSRARDDLPPFVTLAGTMSEPNLFFQNDILRDTEAKCRRLGQEIGLAVAE